MSLEIRPMLPTDSVNWDAYVARRQMGTPFHLSGWQTVIEQTYGHRTHFLLAEINQRIVGVLPLVHMKHILSGNIMISMPFLDMAGVLADNLEVAGCLIHESLNQMHRIGADAVELRQGHFLAAEEKETATPETPLSRCRASGNRFRMVLDLPGTPDALMQSFRSKLRSQIRKPLRSGLETRSGGLEYLDDFYRVFSVNMRDLGSPVHSKAFLHKVVDRFPTQTRIFTVYKEGKPIAASLTVAFGDTVYNPWASSMRRYRDCCPNMLLYWSMLEYACAQGYARFDFGRSSEGEGTYRFKQQWGARPIKLCWYTFSNLSVGRPHSSASADKAGFQIAAKLWTKMPVPISRMIGPSIRKNIGL